MLFVIPQCNNETVSVAQEYLDRAPESVLAIAAQRALPNSVVMLKDWPDANVAVLQAVIGCFSRHKAPGDMAKVQESQLLQALEYFNIPGSMWPLRVSGN
ncbi:hypothetical protein WJX79_003698 [Trebouxia sp. C0005]